MSVRLIRFSKVRDKTGLSRATIWRAERAGSFPQRRQVGPNSVAWLESEIDEWIESRAVLNRISQGAASTKPSNQHKNLTGYRQSSKGKLAMEKGVRK